MAPRWVWLFPLLGAALLVAAACLVVATISFKAHAQTTTGTVVGYYRRISAGHHGGLRHTAEPIIRFSVGDKVIEQRSGVASSPPQFSVGAQVKVLYNPARPEDFKLDSPLDLYLLPGILGFIGVIFLGVGLTVGLGVARRAG